MLYAIFVHLYKVHPSGGQVDKLYRAENTDQKPFYKVNLE